MFQKLAMITTALVTLISFQASAQFMGVELGVRQQSASSSVAGVSTSTEMAYQFGLVGAFPMTEILLFRSGFLYTQRPITAKVGTATTKYSINYFDIPLTVLWKLNDFGGVYGGVNLALAASADCDNCSGSVEKKGAMPLVIGGSFKFAPNFGVDVYFEALEKFNDAFKEGRAVGANLLITFD
jgi:hypothetical protein